MDIVILQQHFQDYDLKLIYFLRKTWHKMRNNSLNRMIFNI